MISGSRKARAAWRDLPSLARQVLLADLVSTTGTGLVLPFLAIYVGRIHHHGAAAGGVAIAALAAGSLLSNTIAGRAADRYGPGTMLLLGWLLCAAGDVSLILTAGVIPLVASAAILGVGAGAAYPAVMALLGEVTTSEQRPLVFGAHYGLQNVGLSGGVLLSALIVAGADVTRFRLLYAVDAVSFLAAAGLILIFGSHIRRAARLPEGDAPVSAPQGPGGYRQVAADRAFQWLCCVNALLVVFGFAQFHAALPVYLSRPDGLRPNMIAFVFAANTVFVAAAAFPVALITQRLPQLSRLGTGAICFAACWVLLANSRGSDVSAFAMAALAAIVMGAGEVALAAAHAPLVNDLAPPQLRGRYNAVDALVLSIGTITGPLLASALYSGGSFSALFVVLTAGCMLAALLTRAPFAPSRVRTAQPGA